MGTGNQRSNIGSRKTCREVQGLHPGLLCSFKGRKGFSEEALRRYGESMVDVGRFGED